SCEAGWDDCNKDPSDGCETNLHVDTMNCTACGKPCTIAHGVVGCSDGCYLRACVFGYDDCNNDNSDGCETSVLTDPKNCGGCGTVCKNVSHATVGCANAACIVTKCDLGYSDCNNNGNDGCEVATGTDKNNCGACGVACPMGLICQNSSCTCPQCNIPGAM